MTAPACTIAMVGLGVMGSSLARNLARHGQRVALYDRSDGAARALAARHPEAGFVPCESIEALVAVLARRRARPSTTRSRPSRPSSNATTSSSMRATASSATPTAAPKRRARRPGISSEWVSRAGARAR
jgi:glycine/D-amino acid oxidase-like deaminating enzyme